jgi:galactonate dehydratase
MGRDHAGGQARSTCAAVEEMADYLVGKDPLRIEHHWQHIYRSSFFRGGPVLMSALSGIDQALWDIAGKVLRRAQLPPDGRRGARPHPRLCPLGHHDLSPRRARRPAERLEFLQTMGLPPSRAGRAAQVARPRAPGVIDGFVKRAYLMREWVGPDIELCFDFHGKMTPGLAIEVCQELKGMRPMFVEEPVPQENVDALKLVSDQVPFPIATGERLLTRWGFREIFEKQAVSLIQPDGSHVGGISELKKVANMAEVYYMHIMPHCAIGPVAFAASMQVDAVVPNFLIQEQVDACLGEGLLQQDWVVKDGFIDLPTKPGLGFDIDEDAAERTIDYAEELGGYFTYPSDGSVADW